MFERETHRRITRVLAALDAEALARFSCWFGGGTRIAMELDEYRESRDAEFLCSDASHYADLRVAVQNAGYAAMFARTEGVDLPREIRADQYGVRFPAVVEGQTILRRARARSPHRAFASRAARVVPRRVYLHRRLLRGEAARQLRQVGRLRRLGARLVRSCRVATSTGRDEPSDTVFEPVDGSETRSNDRSGPVDPSDRIARHHG